jgi:hypothetical protein
MITNSEEQGAKDFDGTAGVEKTTSRRSSSSIEGAQNGLLVIILCQVEPDAGVDQNLEHANSSAFPSARKCYKRPKEIRDLSELP